MTAERRFQNLDVARQGDGTTEAVNLTIKQIKRTGRGFRNFDNYRLRLLLHCGGCNWQDQPAARL